MDYSDCIEKSDLVRRIIRTETNLLGPQVELPPEQWLGILTFLPLPAIARVQRVSKQFYQLINLASFWRKLLLDTYPPLIRAFVNEEKSGDWKRVFEAAKQVALNVSWYDSSFELRPR